MLRKIFALFFRSLRSDSRAIGVHFCWFLLLVIIFCSFFFAYATRVNVGAPGLNFFRSVTYTDAIVLTLLGISYFSSAISEEKEEDTLGLMTMAGLSPLGILLGKSTTRLFQVFLLIAVQYPFTLLAITLGGLMPDQIYAAYLALLAYTILLANLGLFCSVLCRRNRDAAGLTTLWMIGYLAGPPFAYAGHRYLTFGDGSTDPKWASYRPTLTPTLDWISQTSVFGQLYNVTNTGYRLQLTPQLISNSVAGVALFLLSWWLFGIVSHESTSEATTRSMVPRRTSRLWLMSAGRTWNAALVWKDFHFVTGGWFGIIMRCGLYVGLYWLAFAASYPWDQPTQQRHVNWRDCTWGFQVFVVPLFVVDCAMCMSRLFQEEIRHQTLSALMMLPRTPAHVVYSKLMGCLVGLTPGMIAMFSAFFVLQDSTKTVYDMIDEPPAWWLTANLFLVVHLSAMFSTYLRWGAFAMSIALTLGTMFVTVLGLEILRIGGPPEMESMLGMLSIPVIVACAGCHLIVLLRLPALAER